MFRGLFEGPAPWIILIVVLLLFGATRLPALARSLGQSTKILRNELKDGAKSEEAKGDAAPQAAQDAPSATSEAPASTTTPSTRSDTTP
jgi:sec-independent protein translocase protein TatA